MQAILYAISLIEYKGSLVSIFMPIQIPPNTTDSNSDSPASPEIAYILDRQTDR